MKIDEKVLGYYECCGSPVDKEGYLCKKGEIKTSYQKRWFVLKGNLLFYKERPADRDPAGVIVLEGCTVQLCESEEQFAFSLVWSELGLRTYKFAAEDQASQESWIKALLAANHNYLEVLVMDLEKKYREALGATSGGPLNSFTAPDFSTAGAEHPARPGAPTPAFAPYPSAPGPGPSSGPTLQAPACSSKSASRRSPKLWPKRSANVVPVNAPAPPLGDWPGVCSGPKEEFSKLHEEFGKEVKDLIADWLKRGRAGEVGQGEDLIDFG